MGRSISRPTNKSITRLIVQEIRLSIDYRIGESQVAQLIDWLIVFPNVVYMIWRFIIATNECSSSTFIDYYQKYCIMSGRRLERADNSGILPAINNQRYNLLSRLINESVDDDVLINQYSETSIISEWCEIRKAVLVRHIDVLAVLKSFPETDFRAKRPALKLII